VYVQEGIYDEFVKKAVEAARSWKVGDPFDVTSNMGPQVQYIEMLLCVTDKLVKSIHGGSI
jgi:acyl-CoA reductase-like NAD-dependent aldehyde dehydrogenase